MTVNAEDIKNLASLSRIDITDEEATSMTKEIDSILSYVGEVQKIGGDIERETPNLRNVMREDEITNQPGEYKEKILENAPEREGDYLKVKKIL